MSYNFLKVSGSRFRNIIGSDNYDNHWDTVMSQLSASNPPIFSSSQQVSDAESFLQNWENNPSSGSAWFNDIYPSGSL